MTDTAPTPTADAPVEAPTPEPAPAVVPKDKYDRLLADARKHEDRAKANAAAAKELETLRKSSMTEVEAARAEAAAAADQAARSKYGARLVAAELKAAAAGRSVDVEALLEGVDASRFLDDDGEPDGARIAAWVDRVAPKVEAPPAAPDLFPAIGQGPRGETPPLNSDALTADLKNLLGIR